MSTQMIQRVCDVATPSPRSRRVSRGGIAFRRVSQICAYSLGSRSGFRSTQGAYLVASAVVAVRILRGSLQSSLPPSLGRTECARSSHERLKPERRVHYPHRRDSGTVELSETRKIGRRAPPPKTPINRIASSVCGIADRKNADGHRVLFCPSTPLRVIRNARSVLTLIPSSGSHEPMAWSAVKLSGQSVIQRKFRGLMSRSLGMRISSVSGCQ